jgi:hypothetical protein
MPDNALKARAFLFAGAAIAALIATPAAAAEKQFSIAPQDLSSALKAFGRQSGETILYQKDLTGSARSSGAVGKLEPDDALFRILRGSRFEFHKVSDGFVVVPVKQADEPALLIRTLAQTPSAPVAAPAPASVEAVAVEEIVVTGSRAVTNGNAAPTPVTVIGRDQLNLSAPTSVADALAQVPHPDPAGRSARHADHGGRACRRQHLPGPAHQARRRRHGRRLRRLWHRCGGGRGELRHRQHVRRGEGRCRRRGKRAGRQSVL